MINSQILVALFLATLIKVSLSDKEVPIKDRINLLKFQISEQIKEKQFEKPILDDVKTAKKIVNEDYEYIDTSKMRLTPIMSSDQRKRDHKFRLRMLRTTPTTPEAGFETTKSIYKGITNEDQPALPPWLVPPSRLRKGKKKKKNIITTEPPRDIFYRRAPTTRSTYDMVNVDVNYHWVHCQDVVSPFLNRVRCNVTNPRRWTIYDRPVARLIQLIKTDVSNYTRTDIEALMYQISNLPIKLYQWSDSAVSLLMHTICGLVSHKWDKEYKVASYWRLKAGLQHLFASWNLDFGDTKNLLADTRVIRPPCTMINIVDISTMKTLPTMYTAPDVYATTEN